MNTKKVWVIIACLFVFVFSFNAAGKNSSPPVEEIYNSIRYSAPQYEWEESIVNFENEGMNLVCTLTIPKTQKSRPLILVLHGFGGDRKGVPIAGTSELFWDPLARILVGQAFLNYHYGEEMLVTLDAGHNYNYYIGPDRIEDAAYWTTAWFIKTMKKKK